MKEVSEITFPTSCKRSDERVDDGWVKIECEWVEFLK